MYFASRTAAGKMLAEQVAKRHTGEQCAVVGLSDGSVMVGAQIALKLHAVLCLMLVEPIELPREGLPIGGISEDGSFAYNGLYSPGEIEELVSEYRTYIDEEKGNKLSEMHKLLGAGGLIRKDLLAGKTIILVSDGLSSGFSLDVAAEFLKTVKYSKLIIATPLASVPAVDRMHILGDEIYCMNVIQDFITTDHYYETRDVPPHDKIVKTIEKIMAHWK
jgi:putative phosphoribosyl transferase